MTRWSVAGRGGAIRAAGVLLLLAAGAAPFVTVAGAPPSPVEIAGYATSLRARSRNQRYNARRAAIALDGAVIRPGAVFSFNRTVRSWSMDRGFRKAPVSYDGELIREYGGGVCQTSSTLYNVALLAGLPILERHSHTVAPRYVEPGRDAAVAQPTIDLRFRNPHAYPLRLRAAVDGDLLRVALWATRRPPGRVTITRQYLAYEPPAHRYRVVLADGRAGPAPFVRNPGAPGCRVLTFRHVYLGGREPHSEQLSDDSYRGVDRTLVWTTVH